MHSDRARVELMPLTLRLLNYLSRRSRGSLWLLTLLAVLATGAADYLTGKLVTIAFFYLLPISIASWTLGRREGWAIAVLSAAVLEGTQVLTGETGWLLIAWNAASRMGVFLVVANLVAEFHRLLLHQTELSLTDPLTDAANRRAFEAAAEHELQTMRRHPQPLSFGYLDLDNFKLVNDTLGHAAGDQVLVTVAEVLRSGLRGADVMARLGGDEFVILMPQTDAAGAGTVIARLVASLVEATERHKWPVDFSVGLVTCTAAPADVDTLIGLGDELMYAAKRAGKNRIEYGLYPAAPVPSTAGADLQAIPGPQ